MTKLSRALEDNGLDETMNCRDLEAIEYAARLDAEDAYRRGVEELCAAIIADFDLYAIVGPGLIVKRNRDVLLQRLERLKEWNGNG